MNPIKREIIEIAADIVHRQGWNATGLNQILEAAKAPKGVLYYYFESKSDLGVAIVQHHWRRLEAVFARTLFNETLSGREALLGYFDDRVKGQLTAECRYGCPIGSLANEVALCDEKIALLCREALQNGESALAVALERGKKDGSISSRQATDELARMIASYWQGALLLMKASRKDIPLSSFLRQLDEFII